MTSRIRLLIVVLLASFALGTTACASMTAPRDCGAQGSGC